MRNNTRQYSTNILIYTTLYCIVHRIIIRSNAIILNTRHLIKIDAEEVQLKFILPVLIIVCFAEKTGPCPICSRICQVNGLGPIQPTPPPMTRYFIK